MTGRTDTHDLGMVHCRRCYGRPWGWTRRMTGITNIRGWNMIGTLTTGNGAIVTIKTGAHDLSVIDRNCRNRYPGCRELLMAGIAYITTGNMCR